jgi:hypothetical protein
VARNPVPLIIPCHRVVRTDGHIGNYSLGGPHNKEELLEHEGASPDWLEELANRHIRVRGDSSSGVYHLPTCHLIRPTPDANLEDFRSGHDARDRGYRPCKVCRPLG